MKLYEVFAAKRIPLLEGIKFTTAQIEDVKKEQHNIYIGVEYEYHVDMRGAIDHKTLEDQALEDFNDYVQEEVQDLIHEKRIAGAAGAFYTINQILHDNFFFFDRSLEKLSEVQNKLEKSNNESIDIEQKDRNYLNYLLESYQKTVDYIDSNHLNQNGEISRLNFIFTKHLEEAQDFFPVNNLNYDQETYSSIVIFIKFLVDDETRNLFKQINDGDIFPYHLWDKIIAHLMEMESDWEKVQTFIHHTKKITQSFKSFNEITTGNAAQYFEENIEDYINVDQNEWIQDRVETLINGGSTGTSGSATPEVNYIRSILHNNHDNKWGVNTNDIEKVKEDPSVSDGVETVLKPLPLDKAFKQMQLMFDHIKDVGSTSTSTGLHVNMSIKNERFTKENFDPLKLIMLLDNDEMIGKFPIRGCVDDVLEFLTPRVLLSLALKHDSREFSSMDVINHFSKSIDKSKKLQGINFNHIYGTFVTPDERRIEFRYMGGRDYEKRFKEIQRYIYKYAYMLLASFDPDFLRREYLTKAYQMLNKKAKDTELDVMEHDGTMLRPIESYHINSFSDIQFYINKAREKYKNREIDFRMTY